MPARWSRRAFLRLGLVGGIGLGLLGLRYQAGERPLGPFVRGNLRRAWLAANGSRSTVGLAHCSGYGADVTAALRQAWAGAGAPDLRGRRVVLKPNLVSYVAGPPGNTDARVVEAAITVCRELGAADVAVAEGMAFARDAEPVLRLSRLAEVLARSNVPFIDLNYDSLAEVPAAGGYTRMVSLSLPRTVTRGDCLISLAKMKTHHWSMLSAGLKNLFGAVPGARYGWPKNALHVAGVPLAILELYETLRPEWVIVDGIVGMEGDGPLFGSPVPSSAIVVGSDFPAVDAVCCRLMGIVPSSVDYLRYCEAVGLGLIDDRRIDVRGASVAALARRYAPPPSY